MGIQTYTRPFCAGIIPQNTHRPGGMMVKGRDFAFDPLACLYALREVHKELPNMCLRLTETGTCGDNADPEIAMRRRFFLELAIASVATAQKECL
jgi:hypothetical protein